MYATDQEKMAIDENSLLEHRIYIQIDGLSFGKDSRENKFSWNASRLANHAFDANPSYAEIYTIAKLAMGGHQNDSTYRQIRGSVPVHNASAPFSTVKLKPFWQSISNPWMTDRSGSGSEAVRINALNLIGIRSFLNGGAVEVGLVTAHGFNSHTISSLAIEVSAHFNPDRYETRDESLGSRYVKVAKGREIDDLSGSIQPDLGKRWNDPFFATTRLRPHRAYIVELEKERELEQTWNCRKEIMYDLFPQLLVSLQILQLATNNQSYLVIEAGTSSPQNVDPGPVHACHGASSYVASG
ncbi:hypothetical protein B0H19DRAFT_1060405 [Mycena capillaripes]|nr:hypothetical protein B0H19DRAFT_1060405 [Mycena capillaripes]